MEYRYPILILILYFLSATPVMSQTEYNGLQALHEASEGWIIVRLPSFRKKEQVIDSLLSLGTLSESAIDKLNKELELTRKTKDLVYRWYPVAFDSAYHFSKHAFIFMYETEDFQSGLIAARSSDGTPIAGLQNAQYFFVTLQGGSEGDFVFTSKDNQKLSYPVPEYLGMPGFLIPGFLHVAKPDWINQLGDDRSKVYRIYSHVHRLNKAFHKRYMRH